MRLRMKSGAVLPLVLGILLAVTLLLTSLLQAPGGVRRVALRSLEKQQQIYDAESGLIAYLEEFPEGYFPLPKVERSRLGPWADLSAKISTPTGESRLHVLAGIACDSACSMLKSPKLRHAIYDGFKQQLNREIMLVKPPLRLEIKSGNRRLLGRIPSMALQVLDGDLSLDIEGCATGAKPLSGRFIADGSMELRGRAVFDTLRLYSRGPLTIRGHIKARWLEAFSEDRIEIYTGLEFSGVVIAKHEVAFPNGAGKVKFRYPSFAMALDGFKDGSEIPAMDSVLVPDFISGKLKPFLWSLQ